MERLNKVHGTDEILDGMEPVVSTWFRERFSSFTVKYLAPLLLTALLVSEASRFNARVKEALPVSAFMSADIRTSAAGARRYLLERYCDMVVIRMPLLDETGVELALDAAESGHTGVLLITPQESFEDTAERVSGHGVLTLSEPTLRERLPRALAFMLAKQNEIRRLEREIDEAQKKLEELRLVTRAKFLLTEKKQMTENEAHKLIGKLAMDQGATRKRVAERIIERLG